MPRRSLIYGTLIGLFAVAFIFAVTKNQNDSRISSTQQYKDTAGEVLIGGPFSLTTPDGARVTASDFAGRSMLVYFGYTFCPDVCPLDLQKVTMALEQLEQQGVDISSLQPLFITVDPARDTPEVMGQYVSYFHPSLIGLTGSSEDIAAAARAYRVYYAKAANDVADDDSDDDANRDVDAGSDIRADYLMNHSSYIYLMGPDGKYRDHFSSTDSPEIIAEGLQRHLESD